MHRLVREATKKKESLRGKIEIIKNLCTTKGSKLTHQLHLIKEDDLNVLYKSFDAKFYDNDEIVYQEGDDSVHNKSMYIVVTGSVLIIRKYEEMNKITGVMETKEMIIKKLDVGDCFGAEEILLNCPRMCMCRCVGKTILLFLNKLSYEHTWKNKHDGGLSKMGDILTKSTYDGMNAFQKYMVLFTGTTIHISRRQEITAKKYGLTILVDGECEVFQKATKNTTTTTNYNNNTNNINNNNMNNNDRKGRNNNNNNNNNINGMNESFSIVLKNKSSPIRKKRGTTVIIRPPSKFAQDAKKEIAAPTPSKKSILGIIGKGFSLDGSTSEKYIFKARTEVQLIEIPNNTFLTHMTTATKMNLNASRFTILSHLTERHDMLLLKKEHKKTKHLPSIDDGTKSNEQIDQHSKSQIMKASFTNTSTNPASLTSPRKVKMLPHAPPPRMNYSRAAVRSDWRHSSILKDDTSLPIEIGRRSISPPQIAGNSGGIGPLDNYMLEHKKEQERERTAGLREEQSVIRALSPRLQISVSARHRHKRNKKRKPIPIVGKSRRYRLSQLFNRSPRQQGYNRIRRDVKEENRKLGLNMCLNQKQTAVEKVELFDSKNYFGPTTGRFF